jgi:hypothetical protein
MAMIIHGTNGLTFNNNTVQASAGQVLQVVSTTKTDTFTSSANSTWTDITGMSATITPKFSTSKILVQINMFGSFWRIGANACILRLLRNGSNVGGGDASGSRSSSIGTSAVPSTTDSGIVFAYNWIDSPASTSALTYKVQFFQDTPANPIYVNRTISDSDATIWARTSSSIILTEIAG